MSELSQLKGTFSYDEYKLILEALKTKKTTFEDALKGDFTILRHDVEFNIDRAKKIGVIDNEYGIKSTFFFQVISSAYNPFSVKNKAKILSLIKMGHTVGLHFYISHVPVNNFEKLEHEFNLQKKIFEAGLELPCKIFSFHRPAPSSWVLEIRKDYLFGALKQAATFLGSDPSMYELRYAEAFTALMKHAMQAETSGSIAVVENGY